MYKGVFCEGSPLKLLNKSFKNTQEKVHFWLNCNSETEFNHIFFNVFAKSLGNLVDHF